MEGQHDRNRIYIITCTFQLNNVPMSKCKQSWLVVWCCRDFEEGTTAFINDVQFKQLVLEAVQSMFGLVSIYCVVLMKHLLILLKRVVKCYCKEHIKLFNTAFEHTGVFSLIDIIYYEV